MMHKLRALLLVGLFAPLVGCQDPAPAYPSRQPPADFASGAQQETGRELFMDHCASCHGDTGEGRSPRTESFSPPAPDFKSERYAEAEPAYLYWRIAKGKTVEPYRSRGSVMPGWEQHFGSEQIWALVAYLQSRST